MSGANVWPPSPNSVQFSLHLNSIPHTILWLRMNDKCLIYNSSEESQFYLGQMPTDVVVESKDIWLQDLMIYEGQ